MTVLSNVRVTNRSGETSPAASDNGSPAYKPVREVGPKAEGEKGVHREEGPHPDGEVEEQRDDTVLRPAHAAVSRCSSRDHLYRESEIALRRLRSIDGVNAWYTPCETL